MKRVTKLSSGTTVVASMPFSTLQHASVATVCSAQNKPMLPTAPNPIATKDFGDMSKLLLVVRTLPGNEYLWCVRQMADGY